MIVTPEQVAFLKAENDRLLAGVDVEGLARRINAGEVLGFWQRSAEDIAASIGTSLGGVATPLAARHNEWVAEDLLRATFNSNQHSWVGVPPPELGGPVPVPAAPAPVLVEAPAQTRGGYLTPEEARRLGVAFQPPPPTIQTAEPFVLATKTPEPLSGLADWAVFQGAKSIAVDTVEYFHKAGGVTGAQYQMSHDKGRATISLLPGGVTPGELNDDLEASGNELADELELRSQRRKFNEEEGAVSRVTGGLLRSGAGIVGWTTGLFSGVAVEAVPEAIDAVTSGRVKGHSVYPVDGVETRSRTTEGRADFTTLRSRDDGLRPVLGFVDDEVSRYQRASSPVFTDVSDPEIARALGTNDFAKSQEPRSDVTMNVNSISSPSLSVAGSPSLNTMPTANSNSMTPNANMTGRFIGPASPAPVLESSPAPVGVSPSPGGSTPSSGPSGALLVAAPAAVVGAGAVLAGTTMTSTIPFLGAAQGLASSAVGFAKEHPGATAAAAGVAFLGGVAGADLARGESSLIRTTARRASSRKRSSSKKKKAGSKKRKSGARKPMKRAKSAKAKAPAKKRRREDRSGVTRSRYNGQPVFRTKNGRPYIIRKSGPMKGMAKFIPQ